MNSSVPVVFARMLTMRAAGQMPTVSPVQGRADQRCDERAVTSRTGVAGATHVSAEGPPAEPASHSPSSSSPAGWPS